MTDEEAMDRIAQRMSEECSWSAACKVFSQESWEDVVAHLYLEKNLRTALLEAYKDDLALYAQEDERNKDDYLAWKADVATRGGC